MDFIKKIDIAAIASAIGESRLFKDVTVVANASARYFVGYLIWYIYWNTIFGRYRRKH